MAIGKVRVIGTLLLLPLAAVLFVAAFLPVGPTCGPLPQSVHPPKTRSVCARPEESASPAVMPASPRELCPASCAHAGAPCLSGQDQEAAASFYIGRATAALAPFVGDVKKTILDETRPVAARRDRLRRMLASQGRHVAAILRDVQVAVDRDKSLGGTARARLNLVMASSQRLLSMLEEEDRDHPPAAKRGLCRREPLVLSPDPAAVDAYVQACHFSEILSAYNDDREYAQLFTPMGRDSFISDELGRGGIEMMMDYWLVPKAVLADPLLSPEQKLMTAKYTLWQNPDWGGRDHYRDEYWAWEPAFTDADCALFTGNQIAALAAEYAATRNPHTFRRLQRLVGALAYFDELKGEGSDPLATEPRDGRLQRGPKTKNYRVADDPFVVAVRWDGGFSVATNLGRADTVTGRERSNVSRDQYYGVLTGYYVLFQTLSELPELRPEEKALQGTVIRHSRQMLDYLRGPRIRPGCGLAYNIYSLLEGACANPPNLGFIGAAAIRGLEKITDRHVPANDLLWYPLLAALLDLGTIVESFGLLDGLLEEGRTTLTTLNQYMAALLMSDLPRAHWNFFFPADYLDTADSGARAGWRRVVAAYAYKFGDLGSDEYAGVMDEMLLSENLPQGIGNFCTREKGDWAIVEPQTVLEDFVLPFALAAAAAQNRTEIGALLNERRDAMVASGALSFDHTDIMP